VIASIVCLIFGVALLVPLGCALRVAVRAIAGCSHCDAVPVESVTGERVEWLCLSCDAQLEGRPYFRQGRP
jgi:hypothetical protein